MAFVSVCVNYELWIQNFRSVGFELVEKTLEPEYPWIFFYVLVRSEEGYDMECGIFGDPLFFIKVWFHLISNYCLAVIGLSLGRE